MQLYTIKRFYPHRKPSIIATGQTLEDAQKHCNSPDTHKRNKSGQIIWFDGYEKQ